MVEDGLSDLNPQAIDAAIEPCLAERIEWMRHMQNQTFVIKSTE
jgi:hypothetical protein